MKKICEIDSGIDVMNGAKNRAELEAIEGEDSMVLLGPTKVGKTQLHQLAVRLTKARKLHHKEI